MAVASKIASANDGVSGVPNTNSSEPKNAHPCDIIGDKGSSILRQHARMLQDARMLQEDVCPLNSFCSTCLNVQLRP